MPVRTFDYGNRKGLVYHEWVVAPPKEGGRYGYRVIKRRAELYRKLLRDHHLMDDARGVPHLRPGAREQGGYVWNPFTKRWNKVGERAHQNARAAGLVQFRGSGYLLPDTHFQELKLTGSLAEMKRQLDELRPLPDFVYVTRVGGAYNECVRVEGEGPGLIDVYHIFSAINQLEQRPTPDYDRFERWMAAGRDPFVGYAIQTPLSEEANAQFYAGHDGPAWEEYEDADEQQLCVRRAFEKAYPDEVWTWIPEGCGRVEMEIVARQSGRVIRVYNHGHTKEPAFRYGEKEGDHSGRATNTNKLPIIHLWQSLNHVVYLLDGPPDFPDSVPSENNMWLPDVPSLLSTFVELSDKEPALLIALFAKNQPTIYGFKTLTHHYKVVFPGADKHPESWSETGAQHKEFIAYNCPPTNSMNIRSILPFFTCSGGLMHIKPCNDPLRVLDQIGAYSVSFRRSLETGEMLPLGTCDGMPAPSSRDVVVPGGKFPRDFLEEGGKLRDVLENYEGYVLIDNYKPVYLEPEHYRGVDFCALIMPGERTVHSFSELRVVLQTIERFPVEFDVRKVVVYKRTTRDPYRSTYDLISPPTVSDGEVELPRDLTPERKMAFNKYIGRQHHCKAPITKVATSETERVMLHREGFSSSPAIRVAEGGPEQPCDTDDGQPSAANIDAADDDITPPRGYASVYICVKNRAEAVVPPFAPQAGYVHRAQYLHLWLDVLQHIPTAEIKRIWTDNRGCLADYVPPEACNTSSVFYHDKGVIAPKRDGTDNWMWDFEREFTRQLPAYPLELEDQLVTVEWNPLLLEPLVFLTGPAASGKTFRLDDFYAQPHVRCLRLSPTHMACVNMGEPSDEDPELGPSTLAQFLMDLRRFPRAVKKMLADVDLIVIDEATWMSKDALLRIMALGKPLVLAGDHRQHCYIDHQNPENSFPPLQWFRDRGVVIEELTANRRAENERTREIQAACRDLDGRGILELLPRGPLEFPELGERAHCLTSSNRRKREICAEYVARRLPGSKRVVQYGVDPDGGRLEAAIGVGLLIIGTKTTFNTTRADSRSRRRRRPIFRNGEVGFVTEVVDDLHARVKSQKTGKESVVRIDTITPGFATTYHKCQGQTCRYRLYVDVKNMIDADKSLYVAATRMTNIDNLRVINAEEFSEVPPTWDWVPETWDWEIQ